MCVLKATGIAYHSRVIGFTLGFYIGFYGFCVAHLGSFRCCVVLCLFVLYVLSCVLCTQWLPVSLDYPFFIAPLFFPNSYLEIHYDIDIPITCTYIYKYYNFNV